MHNTSTKFGLIAGLCCLMQLLVVAASADTLEPAATETKHIPDFVVLQATRKGPHLKRLQSEGETETILYEVPSSQRMFQFDVNPSTQQLALSLEHKAKADQPRAQGIYALNLIEPSEPVAIVSTEKASQYFFDPLWVNAGRQVAFVSAEIKAGAARANQQQQLWLFDLESETQSRIADNASHPSLSSGGSKIAFIDHNDLATVAIYDLFDASTKTKQITTSDLHLFTPFYHEASQRWIIWSLEQFKEFTGLSLFIKSALAHPGKAHQKYFSWTVDNKNISKKLIQPIANLRSVDLSRDGKYLGLTTPYGIFCVTLATREVKQLRRGSNYYHFRWWD